MDEIWYVYILECSDLSYYTGIAKNIKKRINEHEYGKGSKYVRSRLPVNLVYVEKVNGVSEALKREAHIRKLPRKLKLEIVKKNTYTTIKEVSETN